MSLRTKDVSLRNSASRNEEQSVTYRRIRTVKNEDKKKKKREDTRGGNER